MRKFCPVDQKISYPSEHVAVNAGYLMELLHKTEVGAYQCRHCGDWHLTTQRGAKRIGRE